MMSRSEVVSILSRLAAPIKAPDSRDSRDEQIDNWHKTLDESSFDVFLDLLKFPLTEKEIGDNEYIAYDNYYQDVYEIMINQEIIDALVFIGKKNVGYYLKIFGPLLDDRHLMTSVIEVIGSLQSKEGLVLLMPILELKYLNSTDVVTLVNAFVDIGGLESFESLKKMKVKFSDESPYVLDSIEEGINLTCPHS